MTIWQDPGCTDPEDPAFWGLTPEAEKQYRLRLLSNLSTREEKVAFIIRTWPDALGRELVAELTGDTP